MSRMLRVTNLRPVCNAVAAISASTTESGRLADNSPQSRASLHYS
jgi:hypothetical protein